MSLFAGNLRTEVLSYKLKGFTLENDLRNLDKVYAAGANEAVVFYCARILEAIIKQAHFQFFGVDASAPGNKKPALADMEQQLHEYNLLQQSSYYWAKGLRLLGNDARHELRRINREETEFALVFLEFILTWYFCDFHQGGQFPTIHKGQSRMALSSGTLLLDLAWTLDSSRLNPDKLKVVFGSREQDYVASFAKNFTVPVLLIEIFIALGDHASAERLFKSLESQVGRQKGALKNRFIQLKGLLFSREGQLEEAQSILEGEYKRQQYDRNARPDEIAGILAGVYKRIWNRDNKEYFLVKSYETYQWGWRNSRNSNAYLGINAASTALWLGKKADSIEAARQVKGMLEKRRKMILQNTGSQHDLNYWDVVTLAEANLLSGHHKVAEELYQGAFNKYASEVENINVAKQQLKLIAHALNLSNFNPT